MAITIYLVWYRNHETYELWQNEGSWISQLWNVLGTDIDISQMWNVLGTEIDNDKKQHFQWTWLSNGALMMTLKEKC